MLSRKQFAVTSGRPDDGIREQDRDPVRVLQAAAPDGCSSAAEAVPDDDDAAAEAVPDDDDAAAAAGGENEAGAAEEA